MTSRPSTAAPILAVLAIVLVILWAYVGGYFWLGDYDSIEASRRTLIVRAYRYEWQTVFFSPAAKVEGMLRGGNVWLRFPGDVRLGGVI